MTRYFEDHKIGETADLGEHTVTEDELLRFAREFDPQPIHVDPEAAKASMYGGLIASGWHTASLYMGMLVRARLSGAGSLGSRGVDELRWEKPVRPGDTLRGRFTVVDLKVSERHPERGTVSSLAEVFNQRGERVMFIRSSGMYARRPT